MQSKEGISTRNLFLFWVRRKRPLPFPFGFSGLEEVGRLTVAPRPYPFRRQAPAYRKSCPPYGDKPDSDHRGLFFSRKAGRQIRFWTSDEYEFLVQTEADPRILRVTERPERVTMRLGAALFVHVPNFHVFTQSASYVIELSWSGHPVGPRQQRVADLSRAHHAERGFSFVDLGRFTLRANPRRLNAHILVRHLCVEPTEAEAFSVRDALRDGPKSLKDVAMRSGVSGALVLAAVRRGHVVPSFDSLIGHHTMLRLADSAGSDR